MTLVWDELDWSSDFFWWFKLWKGEAPPCFVSICYDRTLMGSTISLQRRVGCSLWSQQSIMWVQALCLTLSIDVWRCFETIWACFLKKRFERTLFWSMRSLMKCSILDIHSQWLLRLLKTTSSISLSWSNNNRPLRSNLLFYPEMWSLQMQFKEQWASKARVKRKKYLLIYLISWQCCSILMERLLTHSLMESSKWNLIWMEIQSFDWF